MKLSIFMFVWMFLHRWIGLLPFKALACFDTPPGGASAPPAAPPAPNRGNNPNPGGAVNPQDEIRAAIAAVRDALGQHNTDYAGRLDQIEQSLESRADAETVRTLRAELDQIREAAQEREATITEMQRRQREQSLGADGNMPRNRAIEIFGMGCRAMLAQHLRTEIPTQYRHETEVLRNFQTARAQRMGNGQQRATLSADASPGTLMIPTILEQEIIDGVEEVSALLGAVNFIPGLPGNVDLTVLTGRPTLTPKRATVDTEMTKKAPTFTALQIRPDEAYIFVAVDERLLLMNAQSLGAYMMPLLRDSTIQGIVDWLVTGDGSASFNEIEGILAEDTAAYIHRIGAAFSNLGYNDLVATKTKSLQRARRRGQWLVSEELMWGLIGELDRQGKKQIFSTDTSGNPLMLGSPVLLEEAMPKTTDTGVDEPVLGFGDLSAFVVGLQGGIRMAASDQYLFGKNQLAFRSVLNLDIQRVPAPMFTLARTNTAG